MAEYSTTSPGNDRLSVTGICISNAPGGPFEINGAARVPVLEAQLDANRGRGGSGTPAARSYQPPRDPMQGGL